MMPYRNQKLKDFAKDAPHCMCCGGHNDGTVVGAHSNYLEDGKGMATKSHDLVALLCCKCHSFIDGRDSDLTSLEKRMLFYRAWYRTSLWLLETGRLVVGNPPYKD